MIVICIEDILGLSYGKSYEVLDTHDGRLIDQSYVYKIIDDFNVKQWYDRYRFTTLDEFRDIQIDSLL